MSYTAFIRCLYFALLLVVCLACNKASEDQASPGEIYVDEEIDWIYQDEPLYRYLEALFAERVELHEISDYDRDQSDTYYTLDFTAFSSSKLRGLSRDQQEKVAKKIHQVVYKHLRNPDLYSEMEIRFVDSETSPETDYTFHFTPADLYNHFH